MNLANKILGNVTHYMKYSKYIPALKRRENFNETITRNKEMHKKKFPKLANQIDDIYERFVYTKKILPAMRSLQFAGEAIEANNARIFNCSFQHINAPESFSETMFLLLSGVGKGYSVQLQHVAQLPAIRTPDLSEKFVIEDSIEGWSDAVLALVNAYFGLAPLPMFDFSKIRKKGMQLITSGGKAPGAEPLRICLKNIQNVFIQELIRRGENSQLKPINCHSILCHIADAVLSGGIRRAAMIALFSFDDLEMRHAKSGEWYINNPHFARANNSVVAHYSEIDIYKFTEFWQDVIDSKSGEPGISWTYNKDYGFNPCKPLNSLILTKDGYITFEQALTKDSLIIKGIDGEWKEASKPFITGKNRNVAKLQLANGSFIYGTENHLHMTDKGEWKRIDELVIGDRLKFDNKAIYYTDIDNVTRYNSGLFCGWVHGDGWLSKRTDSSGYNVGLCFGNNEFDIIEEFENKFNFKTVDHSQKPDTCKVFSSHNNYHANLLINENVSLDKSDLSWLYGKDKDFKLGFIKSLFTADGSVRKDNSVHLYSQHRSALEVVSSILREFGIYNTVTIHGNAKNYIAKDGKERNNAISYKINVYSGQFKKIGFLNKFKNDLLEKQAYTKIYRYSDYQTIVDIDMEWSVEDVYDITVYDETHAFYDNGIVSHNCHEASLRPNTFCNLVEINAQMVISQQDFNEVCIAAAFINTLQASYTNFHYLRPIWKINTDEDALLGVGITGIASGNLDNINLEEGSKLVISENARVANLIGIRSAARVCVIKPAGTSSIILETSSGIHDWHDEFY